MGHNKRWSPTEDLRLCKALHTAVVEREMTGKVLWKWVAKNSNMGRTAGGCQKRLQNVTKENKSGHFLYAKLSALNTLIDEKRKGDASSSAGPISKFELMTDQQMAKEQKKEDKKAAQDKKDAKLDDAITKTLE